MIFLLISLYINTKHGSRELVDLISSLTFADDDRELQCIFDALLSTEEGIQDWEASLLNFSLGNADIDVLTLSEHATLGGIACKIHAIPQCIMPTQY